MAGLIIALASGTVFGAGLALSQMANPAKVLAFLDVAGNWDPSLALVMGGAIAVTLVAFRPTLKRARPLVAARFFVPALKEIDARLVGGSALFGAGWGLIGLCPGPAFASLAFGMRESLVFIAAMVAGAALARLLPRKPLPEDAYAA